MMLSLLCLLRLSSLLSGLSHLSLVSGEVRAPNNNMTAAGGNWTQLNETFPETKENGTFSGLFGFNDIAGHRCFLPEQELESRIIGGQEAWAHSWPWQVSLCFASMPACGGAIIAPQWILSAAHCFQRYNTARLWSVKAGKHDLDNPEEPGQQSVAVALIIIHNRYNSRTKENDVALLKLQEPLVFTTSVRPINIWTSPLPLFRGCTITGWGTTRENGPRVSRLQEVNVTVLPSDVCNQYYSGRIRSSMFCAGRGRGGVDACQGDSGGPLSCFTGSKYELAGLISWGVGCGRAKRPGVYTKLQEHTQWLYDNTNKMMHDDELADGDDRCGRRQSSSCGRSPGLASLSTSQDDDVSVENVTESCPFFWPWQVSLQSNGRHYCSGVLIHRRWVVTAKHCNVRAKDDVVVLGIHDLRFLSSQSVSVDEVFNLPEDGSFPPKSDLSLLRLSVSARFNSNVSPVCVPDEDEELNDSWSCFTTGWGVTKATGHIDAVRLHHAGLTLVNGTSCRGRWGEGLVTDSHICADPAGSASCMGDSGAPLYCQKRSSYFLFGVVTWGSRRCDVDKPSVFTAVSDFHSWITKVTDDS
ncbi:ovochymase-1 isoform X1 [Hippoglossus hippoglossus]|uniref:ovochymase-1 isoform X1 n=2 Tax=Hippoglossus hippoglossus TaxID=8267 RepID=UPI00148B502E|nr:ovochymase-1 isoform X1 [Hippoglossus hippoglossus]XP_034434191.1 ovochymase-1 isoform X1 [Hippoglossus hippoglossus]